MLTFTIALLTVSLILVSGSSVGSPGSAPPLADGIGPTLALATLPLRPAQLPLAPINTSLTIDPVSANLSSDFWGSTLNNEVRVLRGESDSINATPVRVLVWPGAIAGENYDPLSNTHYDVHTNEPGTALTSEVQFVQLCRAIHCTAIVQVPAEIDDPQIAEAVVNYTEVNLSFHPAYWMIGNEPELWGHWQLPWASWPNHYTNPPTPTEFGQEVVTYVKAIRQVDNSTPILGLPASGCTCGLYSFDQWIYGVLKVTGSLIQAVAFHEYPAGWLGLGDGSLLDFYGTLQSSVNIPTRIVAARQAVEAGCPKCNVSVFVSELGSALSWSNYGQYAAGFSGALSIASQITQAMDDNLTNVDLFATELNTTNSWFDTSGYARPDYALYTEVLDHLGSQAYPVTLSGLDQTLYGIDTLAPDDKGRQDLLVVNDNITHAVQFTPQFAGGYSGASTEAWNWNGSIHQNVFNGTTWVEPYTPDPVPQSIPGGLPANFTLPPQSMVLFESYPSGSTYVQVKENGAPSATRWYATVGPHFYATTASNLSLLLPTGTYSVGSVGIPLPLGGREENPSEQLGPWVASPARVGGASAKITIVFSPQWRMNLTADPANAGTVGPSAGWWNASAPLTLSEIAFPGYAFVGWTGFGPGSYNGTALAPTILPEGQILEKARFVVGNAVKLVETGLPRGMPWTVTVRGLATTSNSGALTVYEPNGTWGFVIGVVPDYRCVPRLGSFTSEGTTALVVVRFIPLHPPGTVFPVAFRITGLPSGMGVPITIREATQVAEQSPLEFNLLNGSYAYRVGYVPGYHANEPLKTFVVAGGPVTIIVPFVPTVYAATWSADGERAGMNWSVALIGQSILADSAWASAPLPNGSYTYRIILPANFTATPRTGTFVIADGRAHINLVFALLKFSALFEAKGFAPATAWSARLGNVTHASSDGRSWFLAANGTYTFDVHAPVGYYAVPSHGNFTVAGASPPLIIQFQRSSDQPSAALEATLNTEALTVSFWIAAAAFAGYATARSRRRRNV